ncbi:hypothetical protein [Actinomyces vulturis]|uniref:hypothetical protein n=1 Tax=Actinomyces vulturis TaxID=1857645 RepID=UPI00082E85DC|nr:hypothetical protein [Actinomyces vulturis]
MSVLDGVLAEGNADNLDLPEIGMFWYGPKLHRAEQMSMQSYLNQGHRVKLFCYEEPHGVPEKVQILDANQVIPENKLFYNQRGGAKGSLGAFSDAFRFRMFKLFPGIVWSDTDMVCLKPVCDHIDGYRWGFESENRVNGALLSIPIDSPLFKWFYHGSMRPNIWMPWDSWNDRYIKFRRFVNRNHPGNIQHGEYGPTGLTQAAKYFSLLDTVQPGHVYYPLSYHDWENIYLAPAADSREVLLGATCLHLWNEAQRWASWDKDGSWRSDSLFEELWSALM